jgi:prevent-host-death family protein
MTTKRISVKRFCERFDEVLDEIQRTGCKYLITKNGRGHVRLHPIEAFETPKLRSDSRKKNRKR